MSIYRLIAPDWLIKANPQLPKTVEGRLSFSKVQEYNDAGYNAYYFPNYPAVYTGGTVSGAMVDTFQTVFVDYDCKAGTYPDKDAFIQAVGEKAPAPSSIVDSGNGIHVYWNVSDLDAMSYLRLQRRLMRALKTDEAVSKLCQLMRVPGTLNTKVQGAYVQCEELYTSDATYTCETLDKALPPITPADEEYCQNHYNQTHGITTATIEEDMPPKFGKLLLESPEAKELWAGSTGDRSKADYRLGHIMYAHGFTKDEARTVLANSAKASSRSLHHRINYAENIISKIWTFEQEPAKRSSLSSSVKDILSKGEHVIKGTRFPCHPVIDNTVHGYRLGQVIGLVAGSGVGKTAFTLNAFRWFVSNNPEYVHFFIPLEQPANEIADRWRTMCGDDTSLHDKVHILSNYDDNGGFRHLSFDEIKTYLLDFQKETGKKIGCVVIDHIGALKTKGQNGERFAVEDICHTMKSFAVETNTLLIMQSQTSREKAGIGDLELNKDAAYGTVFFESYCDYLITLWQPLKRCHKDPSCPTVTAYKFCKIRHKKAKQDVIQEDVPYYLFFDSDTERLRELTQDEMTSFDYFLKQATNKRKADRHTELVSYQSVKQTEVASDSTGTNHNRH